MTQLTPFERDVALKILDGDHPILGALRLQLEAGVVSERRFSGAGFFIEWEIPSGIPCAGVNLDLEINDVLASFPGAGHGARFVLFVRNGFLACLEGFTYDEDWPSNIVQYDLKYLDKQRRLGLPNE